MEFRLGDPVYNVTLDVAYAYVGLPARNDDGSTIIVENWHGYNARWHVDDVLPPGAEIPAHALERFRKVYSTPSLRQFRKG